jgi:hypothetical protein
MKSPVQRNVYLSRDGLTTTKPSVVVDTFSWFNNLYSMLASDPCATLQFEILFYPVDILSVVPVSFTSVVVMTRDVVWAWPVINHWRRASWQFTSVTSRNRLCSINQWQEHSLRLRSSMLLMSKRLHPMRQRSFRGTRVVES